MLFLGATRNLNGLGSGPGAKFWDDHRLHRALRMGDFFWTHLLHLSTHISGTNFRNSNHCIFEAWVCLNLFSLEFNHSTFLNMMKASEMSKGNVFFWNFTSRVFYLHFSRNLSCADLFNLVSLSRAAIICFLSNNVFLAFFLNNFEGWITFFLP